MHHSFVTMGRYDGVVIANFPDGKAAALAALILADSGNVTTECSCPTSDIVESMS